MTFGPLTMISPSPAILTSTPGMGLPTVPNLRLAKVLHGDDRRRLGQTVSLQDDEAERVEELGDVFGQGRAARDEEPDAAARLFQDLGEDQLVGEAQPALEGGRDRLAAQAQGAAFPADAEGPVKDLLFQE